MPRSVAKTLGMAGTVTTERLRELAAFRVEQGCAISL
jgi:hypothetical protein